MAQTRPQYSSLMVIGDELRGAVRDNKLARAAQAKEVERVARQQYDDEIELRKLAVTERMPTRAPRDPIRVTGIVGSDGKPVTRFLDPDTRAVIAEMPEWNAPVEPKAKPLISVWRNGKEVRVEDAPGVVSEGAPRTPREPPAPSYSLETFTGPDGRPVSARWNARTGQLEPVDTGDLTPRVTSAATKPPTGAQQRALGFFNRMNEAIGTLEELDDKISPSELAIINNSPLPDIINNAMLSSAGQQYVNALRMYTEARLRKESGAAIPDTEFANDRRMIGVQANDQAAVIADKRRARRVTMASFASEAGPAYEADYGEPFDRESFIGRSGRRAETPRVPAPPAPGAPARAAGGGRTVNIPGRGLVTFPTEAAAAQVRQRLGQ